MAAFSSGGVRLSLESAFRVSEVLWKHLRAAFLKIFH